MNIRKFSSLILVALGVLFVAASPAALADVGAADVVSSVQGNASDALTVGKAVLIAIAGIAAVGLIVGVLKHR